MTLYQANTRANDVRDNCGFGLIAQLDGEPSHRLVRRAIGALDRMTHRGAIGADGKTGDGCGIQMQLPDSFFRAIAEENNWNLGRKYAIGQIFLSHDPERQAQQREIIEQELTQETLSLVGWRLTPNDPSVLGKVAAETQPHLEQVFVSAQPGWRKKDLERRLYMARRRIEKRLAEHDDFYIVSLSCLVIVYKGLMMPADLPGFYPDLADIRMQTAICVFHQRFSTNTQPRWPLAQPFRFLAHNGEINTIQGNRQWALARSYKINSPLLPDLKDAQPFVSATGSDSAGLDNMLDMLLAGGMDLFRAMRLLIPPAWQGNPTMDDDLRAFYEFNSMHMEPWDGPAGVVMTNGRHVACSLDRNGLRPARYVLTRDRTITVASEVGTWDYGSDEVLEKGRLGPGEMLAVDTYNGTLWRSNEIDDDLKSRHPYREWLDKHIRRLTPFEDYSDTEIGDRLFDDATMAIYHKQFFYSNEEIEQVIRVLAKDAQEATGSMGDDTPIAVLSTQPRLLYDYFRQQFAQVTNPAIDPIRERHVMSLATCIGREQNLFNETSGYADRVLFESPVLMYTDLDQLKEFDDTHYPWRNFDLHYDPTQQSLAEALNALCNRVENAVRDDKIAIVILSDREIKKGLLPIPAAMATGAVQTRLVHQQLRCDSNIVVETASARDSHHFAVLLGLGATAIYPFLAYETVEQLVAKERLPLTAHQAVLNYRNGINKGLLKIMSKMGISTVSSYRAAGLFEVVGIARDVHEECFPTCNLRLAGATYEDFAKDIQQLHKLAWLVRKQVPHGGLLKYVHGGEYHAYNPDVVTSLQQAVETRDVAAYQRYCDHVNKRPVATLRDLWQLNYPQELQAVDVEDAPHLFKRFDTAAMSIGALSPEAHESLAIAMNRLGGHSNSGEGGEDPARFGNERNSRIKQVASGRFGVTPHYLINADIIQIKVAQGAKPGEGGQLPGEKVTAEIAKLRFSVPGVTLISPPPHHDIYSIEDLAQLIFDLKQINPSALISVKLVSAPGIGTIATGVAKAYADLITVSGYDGGTGASPLTSVKYAGSPWELGLAEVHEALVVNGLRHKVRLQVDGGLKTGLDVIKAAILGAESFGFGTAPMVALGCKYLRICHLNNCATGVATQDQTLRQQYFSGLPEKVENYFHLLADEVRDYLQKLGVEKLVDLIGRTDLLTSIDNIATERQQRLDLGAILGAAAIQSDKSLHCTEKNPPHDQGKLNKTLMESCADRVEHKRGGEFNFSIRNDDRSVGASLSGLIARYHGNQGMAGKPIVINFEGTAGQSFGVWNAGGLRLNLVGDANDYVGKGMAGGRISLRPAQGVAFQSHEAIIMGNTCLYGATGGRLYAAGCAGERFAVRNGGAIAVVEGIGDHGCEYMTGGVVVVLGQTGINFGAGMTGGLAYVLDEDGDFEQRLNPELTEALDVDKAILAEHLRGFIHDHQEATGSQRALHILTHFDDYLPRFRLVKPKASDISTLIGRRAQSADELRIQVM
ncbi:glutamate synthase large subunit [Aliidiomarina minuta]|uniref:Glutamate synthase [NADPH] large chain n=1 Tax=Aliidiomarina minuta TaxID=880057 RepID=A0A432W883_9GAMM|nr:glutamate synthase large subunit [Aliidiomarina minuta]RUO26327.1 glutamate synthase large subunit [Aliidiomarina minuta]